MSLGFVPKQITQPMNARFTPALALPAGAQVRVDVFISFGGLLMQLTGDPSKLEDLAVDSQVYLLMRKV